MTASLSLKSVEELFDREFSARPIPPVSEGCGQGKQGEHEALGRGSCHSGKAIMGQCSQQSAAASQGRNEPASDAAASAIHGDKTILIAALTLAISAIPAIAFLRFG